MGGSGGKEEGECTLSMYPTPPSLFLSATTHNYMLFRYFDCLVQNIVIKIIIKLLPAPHISMQMFFFQ